MASGCPTSISKDYLPCLHALWRDSGTEDSGRGLVCVWKVSGD